jgi:class 3 adenylate cyclase
MLPSGLVTFVFTDIEGSTRLARTLGDGYPAVLRQHRGVLRWAFRADGGAEVDALGDACFFVFADAGAAMRACRIAQQALGAADWPVPHLRPKVRIGLHTGHARPQDGEYASAEVHWAARVTSAGHGGQVVCSAAAARHADPLPDNLSVRDLGTYRLRGFEAPEQLFQLVAPGWEARFPPLRADRVAPPRPVVTLGYPSRAPAASVAPPVPVPVPA